MQLIHSDVSDLSQFMTTYPKLVVITGAGLSAASGIPTYRDAHGVWRHSEPIQHQQFVTEHHQRQRYWTRSMLGWPVIRDARPNPAHLALAKMESKGDISLLITQNVDRLHQRAGSSRVIDLHGRLDQVRCLECDVRFCRERFQQELLRANPQLGGETTSPRPDGDAVVADAIACETRVPQCIACGGTLMPDVVFFGGTVPAGRVQACNDAVNEADALLVVGSSLQVYSGFRFCRLAVKLGKPVAIINPGDTRADGLASLKLRLECERLLPALAR